MLQFELDDLQTRLRNTRWPNEIQPQGRQSGTELAFMKELTEYWLEQYDRRASETNLNRFHHHIAGIDGLDIHYIHERSGRGSSVPIVLLHGLADSFYRFVYLIDLLTGAGGSDVGPVFDVVVPSLPGFDFSSQPGEGQMSATLAAEAVAQLMEGLGYERYAVHGGDWGSAVAQELARSHPDRIIGLHLNDVPFYNIYLVDREQASDAERNFFDAIEAWGQADSGYVTIQATKPLTLSYGLSDSPVGLAAWLVEHCQRLAETMPSKDDLITNVMLNWLNNSIRSSIRYYNEGMDVDWGSGEAGGEAGDWAAAGDATDAGQDWAAASAAGDWSSESDTSSWQTKIDVPTAIALFPKDIGHPPREFAERFVDIRRFTVMEHGGHFAALEVPDLVAEDIREFIAHLATT